MSEWISVKDRLPENKNIVDVWIKSHDNHAYGNRETDVLYDGKFCVDLIWSRCYVSHWQPLPEPPKD